MALKVILTPHPGVTGFKADALRAKVANHLGVDPADVLVLQECGVVVADVPAAPVAAAATKPAPEFSLEE